MITKNEKTISDFDAELSCDVPFEIRPASVLLGDDDYRDIKSAFDIVGKYKDPDWITNLQVSEIQADLVSLQAMQVSLTEKFSVLMSYAQGVEEQLKIARSKLRVQAKNLKRKFEENGDQIKVTLDDLKDLSYSKTENIWRKLEESRISADFAKFVYYAVRDHVQMLDHVVQRLYQRGE